MEKNKILKYGIYLVSIVGIITCFALLFPPVRQSIIERVGQIRHKEILSVQEWSNTLLSYALGGIFFILVLNYCFITVRGREHVLRITDEIKACWGEIDRHSFVKPILLMFGIYLLSILTLIRANFLYLDDITRTISGYRGWYEWSRYVSEFFSIFIQGDFHLTDISPLPQLLAILFLAIGSVLSVYVLNAGKITISGLLASIPLGISPYMLSCLAFKYDSPHMALSILASILPFLFLARKKAFVFVSVISLLIMCMTYQAASGIFLLITLVLGFSDWNKKRKTNREILLFFGQTVLSYCMAMVIFKLFLMRPYSTYVSNAMLPVPQMFSGMLTNLQTYVNIITDDYGFIWKALIGIVFCFFIAKSVFTSAQNKVVSFISAIILLSLLFILSYGVYIVLEHPLFEPRALYGFGVLLAITGIDVVSGFNKAAKIFTLALSWSFFIFAFSYGNALADQLRYANFRITILLHDLSALYPDKDKVENKISVQLKNTIGFTPAVKNIAKHNPVIYKLIPQMMTENNPWFDFYDFEYFNYTPANSINLEMYKKTGETYVDFNTLNLPVVVETYYHTIKSDGMRVLVELSEGKQ